MLPLQSMIKFREPYFLESPDACPNKTFLNFKTETSNFTLYMAKSNIAIIYSPIFGLGVGGGVVLL